MQVLTTPDLRGLTALLSGASGGMGFEMARALAEHGARVVICSRGGAKLEAACERLRAAGGAVEARAMDVRDEAAVAAAAEWFAARYERLDLLVNNAGIGNNAPGMEKLAPGALFTELPVETFQNVLATNFLGYFLVCRAFVPLMLKQGGGRIVNVSTGDGTMTRAGMIPYGPSRAGSEAMSRVMAEDLRPYGISVNVICPGGVTDTGMTTPAMREAFRREGRSTLQPDVMNEAILWLASPAAEGLTGEKLVCKDFAAWLAGRNGK